MAEKKAFPELRTYIEGGRGVSLGPVLLRHVVQHIDDQAAEIERLRTRLAAVNIAAHSLASRLTGVEARSVNGKDLIDRGEVIELTMRWRSMWDEAVRDPE